MYFYSILFFSVTYSHSHASYAEWREQLAYVISFRSYDVLITYSVVSANITNASTNYHTFSWTLSISFFIAESALYFFMVLFKQDFSSSST